MHKTHLSSDEMFIQNVQVLGLEIVKLLDDFP